jgi:HK97 family phage major capsid protein
MTPEEIKLQEESNKILSDLRAKFEDVEKNRITKSDFETFKTQIDVRWGEVETELARLKSLPIKTEEKDEKALVYHKAFDTFLRKGYGELSPDEKKVLTIADSTHAGVLATADYVNQIIHYGYTQHPFRRVANVRRTSKYEVQLPTNDAYGVATWVAESAEKTETTGLTYALTTCVPTERKVLYQATQKMLEDADFNIEAEIAYAVGRAFGDLESTAFYSGNGTTTGPEGIDTNATIEADHADLITDNTIHFDDFVKTMYLLTDPYVGNASWLMNRSTLGTIVGLKSATTNTYLLQPNLQAGQPAMILGAPVYTWAAITAQADATPGDDEVICFLGDFRQGYTIVDRIELTIQRLNEKYAEYGRIGFLARGRVGGAVTVPAAIQKLRNQKT